MPQEDPKPEVKIEQKRFTNPAALAREVARLLDDFDVKIIVLTNDKGFERIAQELEGRVTLGRVKIVKLEED